MRQDTISRRYRRLTTYGALLLAVLLPLAAAAAPKAVTQRLLLRYIAERRMHELPDSRVPLKQPLKVATIRERTLTELTLLRESIHAQLGREYKEAWMQAYFDSRPWYKKGGYSARKLTETDLANVGIIKLYENMLIEEDVEREAKILAAGQCNHRISKTWTQQLLFKKKNKLVVKGKRLPRQKKKSHWRVHEGVLEYQEGFDWCEIELYENPALGEQLCRTCRTPAL